MAPLVNNETTKFKSKKYTELFITIIYIHRRNIRTIQNINKIMFVYIKTWLLIRHCTKLWSEGYVNNSFSINTK